MWPQIGETALYIILASVMAFGLLVLIIPVLPGLTIIWLAVLVYAIIYGLNWTSGVLFGLITVFMISGNVIDNVFMGASARTSGASWWAIGAALAAGLLGSILLPPFGGLVFALIALFIIEIIRLKDFRKALESTKSMALGCGWSAVVRFGIGVLMIALWIAWAIWFT